MRVVVLVLCGLVVAVSSLRAQSGKWPIALEALDLEPLAGDLRFAPALFAWLPAIRHDYWVLAGDPSDRWLLVGDRARTRLSVLSRWVSLDEASLARALQVARVQGFDVGPSGAGASVERLLRTGPLRAGRGRSMLSHHDRWQLDDLDRDRTW